MTTNAKNSRSFSWAIDETSMAREGGMTFESPKYVCLMQNTYRLDTRGCEDEVFEILNNKCECQSTLLVVSTHKSRKLSPNIHKNRSTVKVRPQCAAKTFVFCSKLRIFLTVDYIRIVVWLINLWYRTMVLYLKDKWMLHRVHGHWWKKKQSLFLEYWWFLW